MGLFSNLGVDIAGIVNAELGGSMLPATLFSMAPGTRTAGRLTAGTQPTATSYACRGMVSDYDLSQIDGTLVQVGDRKVLLLGKSIAGGTVTPKTGDRVSIEGAEYAVKRVTRDPAGATFELTVRG